jgi:origin recognition complex subunit 1
MPPAKRSRKQSNQPTPKKPTSATSTPRSSRIKKDLEITPLNTRTLPSSLLDSPYKLAQANLHVSAVPTSLPCREREYDRILDFLEGAIEEGTGGCIYISGVPGTGKTATVREVISALHKQVDEEVTPFPLLKLLSCRNWMNSDQ